MDMSFRASDLIYLNGMLHQITLIDLSVGRSVDEALYLIETSQFMVS
jgi:alkyl hydroperoxide reductase subunit AhpC